MPYRQKLEPKVDLAGATPETLALALLGHDEPLRPTGTVTSIERWIASDSRRFPKARGFQQVAGRSRAGDRRGPNEDALGRSGGDREVPPGTIADRALPACRGSREVRGTPQRRSGVSRRRDRRLSLPALGVCGRPPRTARRTLAASVTTTCPPRWSS